MFPDYTRLDELILACMHTVCDVPIAKKKLIALERNEAVTKQLVYRIAYILWQPYTVHSYDKLLVRIIT